MKNYNKNYDSKTNTKLKILKKIPYYIKLMSFLLILILVLYFIYINYIITNFRENYRELFENNTSVYYGNCIYNNTFNSIILKVNKNKSYVDINLPFEIKLTGFYVDDVSVNKKINNYKYSLLIGNNSTNMKSVKNEYNYNKFEFDNNINDILLFDNDDNTPKYMGNKVRIQLENIENMIHSEDYNLKVYIFGLDLYAPSYKEYENYNPFINITNKNSTETIDKSKNYITTINLNTNKDETIDNNKKVIKLNLGNYKNDSILHIKYSNSYDGNKRKYVVKGPIQDGFDVSKTSFIYFNKPIIAEKLYLNGTIVNNNNIDINNIDINNYVYGSEVSRRDEINFKIQMDISSKNTNSLSIKGQKCPNINQMLKRQLQSQQICEALEYKDRIKNSKVIYEKEKIYLGKLGQQEKELQDLEKLLNSLIKRKNDRVGKNKYHNVEELDKELRKIEESRKEAEDELLNTRKEHNLKLELNLDPQYTDIIKKFKSSNIF